MRLAVKYELQDYHINILTIVYHWSASVGLQARPKNVNYDSDSTNRYKATCGKDEQQLLQVQHCKYSMVLEGHEIEQRCDDIDSIYVRLFQIDMQMT